MASTLELLLLARMAGTPVGRAHATAAQGSITTPVQLTLGAVDFDNMGGFSGTGLYTVQVAGTYWCHGKCKFSNANTTLWTHLLLYHNGSQVAVGPEFQAVTGTDLGCEVADLIQCQVGDTIGLFAQSNTAISTAIPDTPVSSDNYLDIMLVAWA